ncbi:MAG: hypothetical protein OXF60_01970 [Gammaproteobacteria bacterium]|nr:hypothetical protein [Gammaproteobacteria bacterium]
MMTKDVILDETADYIQQSEKNLELALQIERALPIVRKKLIVNVLDAIKKNFPQEVWSIEDSQSNMMDRNASLILKKRSKNEDQARIILGSDPAGWSRVWIGCDFGGESKYRDFKQDKVERLNNRGFKDRSPKIGFFKYYNDELKNWSEMSFLKIAMGDDDEVSKIASEISDNLKDISKIVDD